MASDGLSPSPRARLLRRAERPSQPRPGVLNAFDLVAPIAVRVLEDMNECLLDGRGTVATHPPVADGGGGFNGSWTLTWPRLGRAHKVHSGEPLPPVTIDPVYPGHRTHGHLARLHTGLPAEVTAWPMQVLNEADAGRQEPILRAVAEAEIHERIYQAHGDWEMVRKPSTATGNERPDSFRRRLRTPRAATAEAQAGDVLVGRTVRDFLAGSGNTLRRPWHAPVQGCT